MKRIKHLFALCDWVNIHFLPIFAGNDNTITEIYWYLQFLLKNVGFYFLVIKKAKAEVYMALSKWTAVATDLRQ